MKKKILACLLAIAMILPMIPVIAFADGETVNINKQLTNVTTTLGDTAPKGEDLAVSWSYEDYALYNGTLDEGSITIENSNGLEMRNVNSQIILSQAQCPVTFEDMESSVIAKTYSKKTVISAVSGLTTNCNLFTQFGFNLDTSMTKMSIGFWVKDSSVNALFGDNDGMQFWLFYYADTFSTMSVKVKQLIGESNVNKSITVSHSKEKFTSTSATATNLASIDGWTYIAVNFDGMVINSAIPDNALVRIYWIGNDLPVKLSQTVTALEMAGYSVVMGEHRTSPYQFFPTTAGGDLEYKLDGFTGNSLTIPASCVTGDVNIDFTQEYDPEKCASVTKNISGATINIGDCTPFNRDTSLYWEYNYGTYDLGYLNNGIIRVTNSNGSEKITPNKGFATYMSGSSLQDMDNAAIAKIYPKKTVVSLTTEGSLYGRGAFELDTSVNKMSFGFWLKDSSINSVFADNDVISLWPMYFDDSGTQRYTSANIKIKQLIGESNVNKSVAASLNYVGGGAFTCSSATATNLANVGGWTYIAVNFDGIVFNSAIPNKANVFTYLLLNTVASKYAQSGIPFEIAGWSAVMGELRTSPYQFFPTTAGGDLEYKLDGFTGNSLTIPASCMTGDMTINFNQPIKPSLKILMIGNSFTDDGKEFLDKVAQSYQSGFDTDKLIIGNVSHGGRSVGFWANCVRNEVDIDKDVDALAKYGAYDTTYYLNLNAVDADPRDNVFYYTYYENGSWKSSSINTIAGALNSQEWDVVLIQGYGSELQDENYNLDTNLKTVTDYIDTIIPDAEKAFYFTWIGGNVGTAANQTLHTTKWNVVTAAAEGNVDFIIPAGTTIENIRTTYLKDLAYKSSMTTDDTGSNDIQKGLTRDTNHISWVVGRYALAVTIFDSILENMQPDTLAYRDKITTVYPRYEDEKAAIGALPKEYMSIIYDAADAARANPALVTNLTTGDYSYPAVDPAVTAITEVAKLQCKIYLAEEEDEIEIIGGLINDYAEKLLTQGQTEDLKVTIDNADFTDGTYTATVTVQYGYTFKTYNLSTTVSNALATDGTKDYAKLSLALYEAASGTTITINADVNEPFVVVNSGVTLDLNGFDITCKLFYVTGDVVDNGATKGVVKAETYMIAPDSASDFAVKNGDGYSFYHVKASKHNELSNENNKATMHFGFSSKAEYATDTAVIRSVLNGGYETARVKFVASITYENASGLTVTQNYTYTDALMNEFCEANDNAFILSISGLVKFNKAITVVGSFVTYDANGNVISTLKTSEINIAAQG